MSVSREGKARTKLRMLELYANNPEVRDGEVAKIFKMDVRTVQKYKKEIETQFIGIQKVIEKRTEELTDGDVSIWSKITKILGLFS